MPDILHPQHLKTTPWNHQIEAYRWAMTRRGAMLAMAMGTGKSVVAIAVANNVHAMRTLIIGPASALGVWPREFERHSAIRHNVIVLNKGNTADKIKRANDELLMAKTRNEPCVIVVNYETAIRPDFQKFLLSKLWDLIIGDELHRAKSANGATGKLFGKLAFVGKKKLGLTGTPFPHDCLDIFSQYRFLDSTIFGHSYVKFRQTYAKMDPVFPSKVVSWLNQEDLKEKFSRIAFRVEDSVLDLPPYTEQYMTCELSPSARKVYNELEEQLISEVDAGIVTAANVLVKSIRLRQCSSGFVKTEDGIEQQIDDAKERLLTGILEDIAHDDPVVVFCLFRKDLEAVERIAKQFDRKFGEISGRRKDITHHSTMPEDIGLMAVQTQSGGVGIDLTRSRYGIYYSIDFNKGLFDQSEARIHRPGQTRPVHYMHLIAENTIDLITYKVLAKRGDLAQELLSVLKRREHLVGSDGQPLKR